MTRPTLRWLDTNALLIRVAGFVALLSIPFKHLPHRVAGVEQIVPLQLVATSHIVSFSLGLGLLYIASQVSVRKRNAWYVAVILLTGLIVAELLHYRNLLQIALYATTLFSLLKDHRQFVVKSDGVSFRRGILTAAGLLAVVILFAATVFEVIDQQAFGRDLTTGQTVSVTYHALTDGALPPGAHVHRYDRMLLALLHISGVACVVIIGWSLFRPLQLRRRAPASHLAEARALLETYSTSSEDFFKVWPHDKHFFFYEQAFVAYGVSGNNALVLDGVSGDLSVHDGLRRQFLEFARLNGWTVAVIHADAQEAEAWQAAGLNRLFIGSEAVVNCSEFVESTARNKHFRYVANKAAKDGLQFELWQPPLSSEQLHDLRIISNAWLGHGGRREYGFMMGYFETSYVGQCQVAVLKRDGDLVAYANIIPSFRRELASIDHMRFVPGLSSVSMHYLLRELVCTLHNANVQTCNLGLAPLSKLDEQLDKSNNERLLSMVKRLGSRYYSFEGLEQFKGKFQPDWDPRYLVYQGASTKLVATAAALNNLSAYRPHRDQWRTYVIALALLVGLTNDSFPLAFWLNRQYAWHGLVSDLGQSNQPYYWLFNGLDMLSSVLAIALAAILYRHYTPRRKYVRWALIALFVSNLGALLAATVSLPAGFSASRATIESVLQSTVLIHGLSSFINSAGFVLAAILWGVQPWLVGKSGQKHGKLSKWRLSLMIVILAMSTVGAAIGFRFPDSSPFIQRLFITAYTVWIVVITLDITKHGHRQRSR